MIEKMNTHYSMTNPASVYDEEALTALELAGRTTAKVNECVDKCNETETNTEKHLAEQDSTIEKRMDAQDKAIPVEVSKEVQNHIRNGAFDTQIDKSLNNLNERVDNLLGSLETGGTTGDAELIDMRVSADGTTYQNAGQATREQIADLRNMAVKPNLTHGVMKRRGYILANGNFDNGTGGSLKYVCELSTDLIPINPTLPYHLRFEGPDIEYTGNNYGWVSVCYYDQSQTFIRRDGFFHESKEYNHRLTVPENAYFVAVSYRSFGYRANIKLEQSSYPTKNEDMKKSDNLMENYPLLIKGFASSIGMTNAIGDCYSLENPSAVGAYEEGVSMDERLTELIPVRSGETYKIFYEFEKMGWVRVVYVNENMNMVNGVDPTIGLPEYTFTIPEDIVYMIVTARTHYLKHLELFKLDKVKSDGLYLYEAKQRGGNDGKGCVHLNKPKLRSVAHRGCSGKAPENTMPAFRQAVLDGFEIAECDILFTSDNVPVLLHDATIDRTSNGTGYITSMTYADALQYDFGFADKFGEQFKNTKIPTLEEFLRFCKATNIHPYIEVKGATTAQMDILIDMLKHFDMVNSVSIISFDYDLVNYASDKMSGGRVGYIVVTITEDTITKASALMGGNSVFIDTNSLEPEQIALCENAGIPVEYYTTDDVDTIINLPPYVSGVTSNILVAEKVLFDNAMEV